MNCFTEVEVVQSSKPTSVHASSTGSIEKLCVLDCWLTWLPLSLSAELLLGVNSLLEGLLCSL